MARIRTIKPEFWASEQVMNCSRDARLLFVGIWNFCDDHGRHVMSARTLKAEVFPGDDDITAADVQRMFDELSENDLVKRYVVDGKEYFEVTGWRHQKIDKPQPAKHPGPCDYHSPTIPRMVAEPSPTEKEGKGKEDLSNERSPPMAPPKPSNASSKRGSRLPKDWTLPDDWRAWAETERPGLDIERTAADFRDYWHARAGPQGVKLDWLATWRLWVRRQADGGRTGGNQPRRGQLTDAERRSLIAGGYAESMARERSLAAWDDG